MKIFIRGFILGALTFYGGAWVYIFSQELIHGGITLYEPNTPILIFEIISTALITIGGIILIIKER